MYSETLRAALIGAEHQDCHLRAFCKTADNGTAVAERLRAKEKGASLNFNASASLRILSGSVGKSIRARFQFFPRSQILYGKLCRRYRDALKHQQELVQI